MDCTLISDPIATLASFANWLVFRQGFLCRRADRGLQWKARRLPGRAIVDLAAEIGGLLCLLAAKVPPPRIEALGTFARPVATIPPPHIEALGIVARLISKHSKMQCVIHPASQATMRSAFDVFCWDCEHIRIVVVVGAECPVPIVFLAISCWAVCVLAPKVKRGDL